MIKVIGVGSTRQFVSRSAPFQVMCPGDLTMISFGRGEDGAVAFLYGHGHKMRSGKGPPPLGVHPDSVAARGLWSRLCDRTSDRLQAIMTAPEPATP
jgi:hypothetical protein